MAELPPEAVEAGAAGIFDPNLFPAREHDALMAGCRRLAREVLAAVVEDGRWALVEDHAEHVIDLGPYDWSLQHPPRCRPDLLGCDVHQRTAAWLDDIEGPPAPPGRYLLTDDLTLSPLDVEPRRCRQCGCTDTQACVAPDGSLCSWAEIDLCTSCPPDFEEG